MTARWTFGPDKNGGSRDLFLDGVLVLPSMLSSEAVIMAGVANAAIKQERAAVVAWLRANAQRVDPGPERDRRECVANAVEQVLRRRGER